MPRSREFSTTFRGNFFPGADSHVQKHEIAVYSETTLRLRLVHEPFLDSLERLASSSHADDDSRRPQFCMGSISQA